MINRRKEDFDNLVDLLRWRAKIEGDKTVYTFLRDDEVEGSTLTFAQLDRRARAIAARLQKARMSGRPIMMLYPAGIEFITAFFGCLYAGCPAVPTHLPHVRRLKIIQTIVADSGSHLVLTTTSILSKLKSTLEKSPELSEMHWLATDTIDESDSDSWEASTISSKDLAFLQYTSGSVGTPKGVMISHSNLINNERMVEKAFIHDQNTIFVGWLPLFHDMGLIGNVLQPLYLGIPCYLMSPVAFLQKPIRWLRAISRYGATTSGAPNFAYDLCVRKIDSEERSDLDLGTWRVAFNGSEPVLSETIDRFSTTFANCGFKRSSFYPCYGLAEATLFVSGGDVETAPTIQHIDADALAQDRISPFKGNSRSQKLVGCGHTWLTQRLVIADPKTFQHSSAQSVGEIWIAGPNIAKGYWNREEDSRQIFGAYLSDTGDGPFLRTGDLGFVADNELFITGRLKDIILIHGRNHYPQDIELSVSKCHTALRPDCGAAFTIQSDGAEQLIVVHEIERVELRSLDIKAVSRAARKIVSIEHGLDIKTLVLIKTGTLPKTTSGKVKRRNCRAAFIENQLDEIGRWDATTAPLTNTKSTPIDKSNKNIEQQVASHEKTNRLIAWLRSYAEESIDSRTIDERRCIPPHIVLDFGNKGLLGLQISKEQGGLDLSHRDFMRLAIQLGAIDLTLALFVGLNNVLGIRPILRFGSRQLRAELLPELAQGRQLGAFALTEPGAGSNPRAIETRAIPTNGGWILSGEKSWIGSAAWAGVLTVFGQTFDDRGRPRGLGAFVIHQGTSGLRQGAESMTMGLRGMVQNTVYLDDVFVDNSYVLGLPGQGMEIAQDAMMYGRLGIAALSLGGMKRCAQLMLRYAERRVISTGRLLDNPVTLTRLSELNAGIICLERLIDIISDLLDAGRSVPVEAYAACKVIGPELYWKASDGLVQLLGGRGYIEDNIAPQILRDARILRIFEGPTETVAAHLGSRLLNNKNALLRFLSEDLGSPSVAEHLNEAACEIQRDSNGGKTLFAGRAAMKHWANTQAGHIASWAILWAVSQGRAAKWAQTGFEHEVRNALDGGLATSALECSDEVVARIGGYNASIGDIDQNSVDAGRRLDPLLRRDFDRSDQTFALLGKSDSRSVVQSTSYSASKIQAWLEDWLRRTLNVSTIDPQCSFAEYGLDSINAVEFAHELEEWLGGRLQLEANIAWNFPTVNALADYLESELNTATSERHAVTATAAHDLSTEVVLDPEILSRNLANYSGNPHTIFISGGTGFLGAYLMDSVLRFSQANLVCLVRATSSAKGLDRLRNNLVRYGLWDDTYTQRISPIAGDLAKPNFGLNEDTFVDLANRVDVLFHSGAQVNYVYPYGMLKGVNVDGTRNILRFAALGRPTQVHYVSSYAVFESPNYAGQPVDESDPAVHSEGMLLGYSQSKWVAEQLCLLARKRGLPIWIYRLPLISGHSRTGMWNTDDFTCRYLKGCIEMGAMPDLDFIFDFSPVDFVVEAMVHHIRKRTEPYKTLHLINRRPMHINRMHAWLQHRGYPIEIIPYAEWQLYLKQTQRYTEDPLYGLRAFFLEELGIQALTVPQLYERTRRPNILTDETYRVLNAVGIDCPAVDERLMDIYWNHLVDRGFMPEPDRATMCHNNS